MDTATTIYARDFCKVSSTTYSKSGKIYNRHVVKIPVNRLVWMWRIHHIAFTYFVFYGGVNNLESVGNSILSSNLSIIASPCLAVIAGDTIPSTVLLLVQG